MNNGENLGDFPRPDSGEGGQNAGAPDGSSSGESQNPMTPEELRAEYLRLAQAGDFDEAWLLAQGGRASSQETADPTDAAQVRYGNFVNVYSQPGLGREVAASNIGQLMLEPAEEQMILDQIPSAADMAEEGSESSDEDPDDSDTEPPQHASLGEQLGQAFDELKSGGEIEEALASLPAEVRDTYKKPLEAMVEVERLKENGQAIPAEKIEDIKNAFMQSDMDVDAAEILLAQVAIPEEAKDEIKEHIAQKQQERGGRREDNQDAASVGDQAEGRLSEVEELLDDPDNGMTDAQRSSFRQRMAVLHTQLEDAGVNSIVRGTGKTIAVAILLALIFMIWQMQVIGKMSAKKR